MLLHMNGKFTMGKLKSSLLWLLQEEHICCDLWHGYHVTVN
jgi:hypothetical protein